MIIKYKLKMFNHILYTYFNIKENIYVKTTFDEVDLQSIKFNQLKVGMVVAVVTYEDDKFFCADGVIIKNIIDKKIFLENGKCFNMCGKEII